MGQDGFLIWNMINEELIFKWRQLYRHDGQT